MDTEFYKSLGERIKALREQKGVYQDELASAMGKHAPAISIYENAHRRIFADDLMRIAQHLGVSVSHLLNEHTEAQGDQESSLLIWFRGLPSDKERSAALAFVMKLPRDFFGKEKPTTYPVKKRKGKSK